MPSPAGSVAVDPQIAAPRVVAPRPAHPKDTTPARVRRTPAEPADLAQQVATAVERRADRQGRDRAESGRHLVPVQRPADGAALLELACATEHRSRERWTAGRHRAPETVAGQRVVHFRIDRDDRHRDDRHRDDRHRDDRHRDDRHEDDRHEDDRDGRYDAHDRDDERSGWDWFATDRDGDRVADQEQAAHHDTDVDEDADRWDWFEADRDDHEDTASSDEGSSADDVSDDEAADDDGGRATGGDRDHHDGGSHTNEDR